MKRIKHVSYADREDSKRRLYSIAITLALYGSLCGIGLIVGLAYPQQAVFKNTTVVVHLKGPEEAEPGLGSSIAAPETPAPEEAPVISAPASAAEAPARPKAEAPKPEAMPADTQPSAVAVAPVTTVTTIEAWVPGLRNPGSRISDSSSSVLVPGKGEIPWQGSTGESLTIRQAEKGNAMETTLGAASGTVGQSLYVPIYLSLPLPRTIPAAIYNAIPDLIVPPNTLLYTAAARQKAFRNYYEQDEKVWRLKNDVPPEAREPMWQMLEDAGLDLKSADYKTGKNLVPVIIGFTVTKDKQLKGVEIVQSSGDAAVDQAVLYGFKRASFWNKTGESVPGRFTYRFDR